MKKDDKYYWSITSYQLFSSELRQSIMSKSTSLFLDMYNHLGKSVCLAINLYYQTLVCYLSRHFFAFPFSTEKILFLVTNFLECSYHDHMMKFPSIGGFWRKTKIVDAFVLMSCQTNFGQEGGTIIQIIR